MGKIDIAIVGAGAVGANLAEQIVNTKLAQIHFLASGERFLRLEKNGTLVNGDKLAIPVYSPETVKSTPDLVLLCVKATQLAQTLEEIAPTVGEKTQVLSFLNGVESEEIIAERFGWHRTLYGYVVGIDAMRTDNHTRVSERGLHVFGRADNTEPSAEVRMLESVFKECEVRYDIPTDMKHSLWWKFMVNVGINPVSAILRAPYGVLQTSKHAQRLMSDSIKEVRLIAAKQGVTLSDEDVSRWHKILSSLDADAETSMLQDVNAKRETEVGIFCDTVCKMGVSLGVATPLNKTMASMLHAINDARLSPQS